MKDDDKLSTNSINTNYDVYNPHWLIDEDNIEGIKKDYKNHDLKNKIHNLKTTIAQVVNERLGKDKNNPKILHWDTTAKGCKNGKILNTRCIGSKGRKYINEFNKKYDELTLNKDGKRSPIPLEGLKSLLNTATQTPVDGAWHSCCCGH